MSLIILSLNSHPAQSDRKSNPSYIYDGKITTPSTTLISYLSGKNFKIYIYVNELIKAGNRLIVTILLDFVFFFLNDQQPKNLHKIKFYE